MSRYLAPMIALRPATVDDVPVLLAFIRALAAYERLGDRVVATEDDLRQTLFGPRPAAEVVLACDGAVPIGFALYFSTYSTFLGQAGLWLEDLFVDPDHRGKGVGRTLLAHLARLAVERGCGRLEWSVLDWNEPALRFYRSMGAESLGGWTIHRLTGEALDALGARDR